MLGSDVTDRNDLLPGQGDVFTHGSPALHAKGLIMLAGVVTTVATGGAYTTVGIGIDGDSHALHQMLGHTGTRLFYHCTNLMTGHHWHLHHRVQPTIGVQVTAAETHILDTQQHLVCPALGLFQLYYLHL